MKFINLTPHKLNIVRNDGSVLDIPRTQVAGQEDRFYCIRIAETRHNTESEGILFSRVEYGLPYLAIINGKGEVIETVISEDVLFAHSTELDTAVETFLAAIKGGTHVVVAAMLAPFVDSFIKPLTAINFILAPDLLIRNSEGDPTGSNGFSIL
jgi:hypothetical protein